MHIFELSQDLWNNSNQEVNSLPISKSGDEYYVNLVGIARLFDVFLSDGRVWSEFVRVNGVWNGKGLSGIEFGSENEIVFAGMTNANGSIQIAK